VRAPRLRTPGWARSDALLPLLVVYFAFSAYYVWQAWRRDTPAIFTDELELTQISRAVADTGRPARREVAYHFTSLYPWLTAPAWWLHPTKEAFDTVKYLGTLAMTAALFPAYGIARSVLSQAWAIAAAVGAIAAPALSYSPIIAEEPVAYLASTITLWLLLRAALRPGVKSFGLALAATIVALAVRSELVALLGAFVVVLAVVVWRSGGATAWRRTWSLWDWAGAIALILGLVIVLNSAIAHSSQEWERVTTHYKDRIWSYGAWAGGGLAIGLGVLPVAAGLAALVPRRRSQPGPERAAFTIVAAAGVAAFAWYAAIKGAYLSTSFSADVVERNLIYVGPLLFAGTALLIAERGTRWWWGLACGAFTLYLVVKVPYHLDNYPYYEAHGLAIAAFANRIFHWPDGTIQNVLIALAVVSTGIVVGLARLPRRGRAAAAAIATIGVAVLAWNLTAETYAANGEYRFAHRFTANLTKPFDWVDRATGGHSTTILGQEWSDPNGIYLTEFWNRSIKLVWSADPTTGAPGPGPTTTPDLLRPDGTMRQRPDTKYVLAVNGVTLQTPVVARAPDGSAKIVYKLEGYPFKLRTTETGIESDGWLTAPNADVPAFSAYNRFDSAPGIMVVKLNRVGYAGKDVPGHVTVRLGTLVVGTDRQPAIGRVLETKTTTIHACGHPDLTCSTGLSFRSPGVPFRIEVTVSPTFSPSDFDPRADRRHLAVQLVYSFLAV
jgi:hypothetical protein